MDVRNPHKDVDDRWFVELLRDLVNLEHLEFRGEFPAVVRRMCQSVRVESSMLPLKPWPSKPLKNTWCEALSFEPATDVLSPNTTETWIAGRKIYDGNDQARTNDLVEIAVGSTDDGSGLYLCDYRR